MLLVLLLLLTAYDFGTHVEIEGHPDDVARFGKLIEIKKGIIITDSEEKQAGFLYAVFDYRAKHKIVVIERN